ICWTLPGVSFIGLPRERIAMPRSRWNDSSSWLLSRKPPAGSSSSTRCGKSRSFICPVISDLRRVISPNAPPLRASPPHKPGAAVAAVLPIVRRVVIPVVVVVLGGVVTPIVGIDVGIAERPLRRLEIGAPVGIAEQSLWHGFVDVDARSISFCRLSRHSQDCSTHHRENAEQSVAGLAHSPLRSIRSAATAAASAAFSFNGPEILPALSDERHAPASQLGGGGLLARVLGRGHGGKIGGQPEESNRASARITRPNQAASAALVGWS